MATLIAVIIVSLLLGSASCTLDDERTILLMELPDSEQEDDGQSMIRRQISEKLDLCVSAECLVPVSSGHVTAFPKELQRQIWWHAARDIISAADAAEAVIANLRALNRSFRDYIDLIIDADLYGHDQHTIWIPKHYSTSFQLYLFLLAGSRWARRMDLVRRVRHMAELEQRVPGLFNEAVSAGEENARIQMALLRFHVQAAVIRPSCAATMLETCGPVCCRLVERALSCPQVIFTAVYVAILIFAASFTRTFPLVWLVAIVASFVCCVCNVGIVGNRDCRRC